MTANIVMEMAMQRIWYREALLGTAVVLFVFDPDINLSFLAFEKEADHAAQSINKAGEKGWLLIAEIRFAFSGGTGNAFCGDYTGSCWFL